MRLSLITAGEPEQVHLGTSSWQNRSLFGFLAIELQTLNQNHHSHDGIPHLYPPAPTQ